MEEKINPRMEASAVAKAMAGMQKKESIFWIETDKIKPNPLQPRREFDESTLSELANSIREYGILQPIVVTRKETSTDFGQAVEYELLAGERRLRASKLIGLSRIPVVVRDPMTNKVKLELALVENLQREDLNPIDKAVAFKRLMDEFGMLQKEVAKKVGKSREVVANTIRLLALPQAMQQAVASGVITEGHTRPLLMLSDYHDEQQNLYNDIITKNLSVREAERISRTIAKERARALLDPDTRMMQEKMEHTLGTRVSIEKKGPKGRISIEFFSEEELRAISDRIASSELVPRIAVAGIPSPDPVAPTVSLPESSEMEQLPHLLN